MKTKRIGLGVVVLAALTLASGSTSVAQTNDGFGGKDGHKARHDIIVKGNHNQIVVGNDNVVARGDVSKGAEADEGEESTAAPKPPYVTVNTRVSVTGFLSEREGPTTEAPEVARFSRGTQIPIKCFVPDGEPVNGNSTWYQVRAGTGFVDGFVSAHFANLTGGAPICEPDEAQDEASDEAQDEAPDGASDEE